MTRAYRPTLLSGRRSSRRKPTLAQQTALTAKATMTAGLRAALAAIGAPTIASIASPTRTVPSATSQPSTATRRIEPFLIGVLASAVVTGPLRSARSHNPTEDGRTAASTVAWRSLDHRQVDLVAESLAEGDEEPLAVVAERSKRRSTARWTRLRSGWNSAIATRVDPATASVWAWVSADRTWRR